MKNFSKLVGIVAVCAGLSACGGSGMEPASSGMEPVSSKTTEERLLERTRDYQALFDRTTGISSSGQATINNMHGTASFTGAGVVAVNPDSSFQRGDAILLGDAQIDVNFGNGTIVGSIENLYGIDSRNEIDEYSGTISISGGNIGSSSHNDISANYAGTIFGNGDSIVVSGEMGGTLLGNPLVRVIDMAGVGVGSLNGANATAIVGVVVEAD